MKMIIARERDLTHEGEKSPSTGTRNTQLRPYPDQERLGVWGLREGGGMASAV